MGNNDYYKTLGVDRNASPDEIKKAYRRMARKYHPDVSKATDAETQFKAVNEAYDVLKDPEKKSAYDQFGSQWQQAGEGFGGGQGFNPGGADFGDIFESVFRQQGSRRGGHGFSSRGEDQQARARISLQEAFKGTSRLINIRSKKLRIKIPAGTTDGQKIRLRGKGAHGANGGANGDLILLVKHTHDPHYQSKGKDIILELPITPWEAVLGDVLSVPTLGGPVKLTIPAGSQSGKKLRLRGMGLPGTTPGDQYIQLQIRVPDKSDPTIMAAYEKLAETAPFNPRKTLA
ncbi:MAG: DnaJ domain-containing protein [Gammaproteobacteria bacterium]|nr:DnaJ domain-containing protein [Gammaproteobacteria bacterium]